MPEIVIRDLPGAVPPSEVQRRLETEDLAWPEQDFEDAAAMNIVLADVERTEGFLVSRQYTRQWDFGDRLFYAYVAPEPWPGTQVPRSSLGMPMVSTHLFSLLSSVVQAFFSGSKPLQIDARPGTDPKTADANQALVMWELEQCNFKQELIYLIFDLLLYGQGNGWWGFQPVVKKKRRKVRKEVAPVLGETKTDSSSAQKVGGSKTEVVTVTDEETWVLPKFEYSHIRHYGADPGCRRGDIRTGKFAYRRIYLSAEDLDNLRDVDGYQNIPSRELLEQLTTPDKEPASANALEMGTYSSTINAGRKALPRWEPSTADPLKQGFEVIEYWTGDRTICVLERQLAIRNATHELGEIPSLSCPFFMSPDSYYGMGLTHMIGNFQRVMQGTVNLMLDDMTLNLNGMYVSGKGYNSSGQAIWAHPGKVVKVDDAVQFKPIERQPVGGDAMGIIQACQQWAQQADGAAEISVQGSMPAEKSSITRTATGANQLDAGARTRMEFLIDNIADLIIIPLVNKFIEMNFDNLAPEQVKTILGEELGHQYEGDPINILNGQYKVTISAGARLQARNAIAQQWPMLLNMITSPSALQGLQTEGKKINYSAIMEETFKAAGYPGEAQFIVPMTPEDIKRMEQMNPSAQKQALQQSKIAQEGQNDIALEESKVGGRALVKMLLHAIENNALGG
ncbi:MAG TPA: hypothetical protein VHA06_17895 [Candidatus Angelobacter sp.]|nr:hypothetical protein [Candidatus Angelobacter sp.]